MSPGTTQTGTQAPAATDAQTPRVRAVQIAAASVSAELTRNLDANTPDSSEILKAKGENVLLASGTKLTLNVIPAQA